MNNQKLAIIFAALTALFVLFNFTLEDTGTIFVILAVLSGLLTVYFFKNNDEEK